MAESPRRLDLRLTISGAPPYRDIAVELAVKFAEYAGASRAAAQAVSHTVAAAVDSTDGASAPVDLRLSAVDGEVTVTTAPTAD
jgi:hypothetical protein